MCSTMKTAVRINEIFIRTNGLSSNCFATRLFVSKYFVFPLSSIPWIDSSRWCNLSSKSRVPKSKSQKNSNGSVTQHKKCMVEWISSYTDSSSNHNILPFEQHLFLSFPVSRSIETYLIFKFSFTILAHRAVLKRITISCHCIRSFEKFDIVAKLETFFTGENHLSRSLTL